MSNIYVGNLSFNAQEDDLKSLFSQYGDVNSARIITDRYSGQSKGFGFVEMAEKDSATAAISDLDGKEWQGRNLRVNEAEAKPDRPRNNRREY